ncbi:MAG TPA: MFS transporter [Caulobacterales bacterium]|nr:MFS transporter [Caulobacterales bacterium]
MTERPDGRTSGYRWYVLAILVCVYMTHHLDRVVFSLLQEPIKKEFHLSDSELALVSGTVFAIAFGIAGLPVGHLADRTRRIPLLSFIIAVWSGLTAMASFSTSLLQLLLVRVGIGVAESGSTPTNLSLISDYFQTKRSTAIGIYLMGSQIGTLVGFAVTGIVAAHYGWRAGLLTAGLPGFFLILLLLLTVREPPRQAAYVKASLVQGVKQIGANPVLVHLIAATTIVNVVAPGISLWLPSLLMRSGGADIGWTGMAIGFVTAPVGIVGTLLAGIVAEKMGARRPAGLIRLMAMLAFLYIPAILLAVSSGPYIMLLGFCIHLFCHMCVSTPGYALSMNMSPPHLRGTTGAVLQVLSNLLGFGVGPMVGGVLSDLLRPQFGADSLRYALGIFVFLSLWAVWHLLRAAKLLSRGADLSAQAAPV